MFDKYLRNFYPNIILISYANDQELIEILPSLLAARNFKKVVYIKQSLSSIENCLAEYLKLFEFIVLPFVNIKSLHQLQETGELINNTHHARPLLTSMAISQMSRIKDNPPSLLERIEIPSETLLPTVASFHLSQYAKRFIDPEFVLPDHHEINFQSKVELQEVISQESQKISIIISEIAEPCD